MKTLLEGEDLVTADLLNRFRLFANLDADGFLEILEKRLKVILNCLCKLSVYSGELGPEIQTDLAIQLLEQACQRVLSEAGIARIPKGFFPNPAEEGPLSIELKSSPRILINIATADDLE